MVHKSLQIVNPSGLHLRPSGILARTADRFRCECILRYKDRTIRAKSVLDLIQAGIKCGEQVELVCEGEDEEEALKELTALIENGMKNIE